MVACFGEIMMRLNPQGYKKILQDGPLEVSFAGSEANVAVALKNLGVKSTYITALPQNDLGFRVEQNLRKHIQNVNVSYEPGRMGLLFLEKGASQRPSKVIYDRENSSIRNITESSFNWEELLKDHKHFHFSGITAALGSNVLDNLTKALRVSKDLGLTVSCDINYRSKLWSKEEASKVMKNLFEYVDVLISNEEDARVIFNFYEDAEDDVSTYSRLVDYISAQYGFKLIAFSNRNSIDANVNNWNGFIFDKQNVQCSKEYSIKIVDRVGAGDSFAAGVIFGFLNQYDIKKTVDFAIALSTLKHTVEGDFSFSTLEDVLELMDNYGKGRIVR